VTVDCPVISCPEPGCSVPLQRKLLSSSIEDNYCEAVVEHLALVHDDDPASTLKVRDHVKAQLRKAGIQ